MSWSNQKGNQFQEQTDLDVLKRNYANAELAYQSLRRDYQSVLSELKTTKLVVQRLQETSTETEAQFNQVKQELAVKTQQVSDLILKNEAYFNRLEQSKQDMNRDISEIVAKEMTYQKEQIIRMDRFVEYFPTILSLIALAGILFFIFKK